MKRLTITYDGQQLFDADVSHFHWDDEDGSVSVRAGNKSVAKAGMPQLLSRAVGELAKNGRS